MVVGKLEISSCSILVYYIPEHVRIKIATQTDSFRNLGDGRDSLKVFMDSVSLWWGEKCYQIAYNLVKKKRSCVLTWTVFNLAFARSPSCLWHVYLSVMCLFFPIIKKIRKLGFHLWENLRGLINIRYWFTNYNIIRASSFFIFP